MCIRGEINTASDSDLQKLVKINNQHGNFSFWKASPAAGGGIAVSGSGWPWHTCTLWPPPRKVGGTSLLLLEISSQSGYHLPSCSPRVGQGPPHPAWGVCSTIHPQRPLTLKGPPRAPTALPAPAPHSELCVSGTPSLPLLFWYMRFWGDKYFRALRALRAKLLPK